MNEINVCRQFINFDVMGVRESAEENNTREQNNFLRKQSKKLVQVKVGALTCHNDAFVKAFQIKKIFYMLNYSSNFHLLFYSDLSNK